MVYNMLGLIATQEINDKEIQLSFEIPDNCFYDFTNNSGNCTVSIKLNPGQTDPSTNFVNQTEVVNISNNVFNTKFEQYEKSGNIIKKPNLTVEFI